MFMTHEINPWRWQVLMASEAKSSQREGTDRLTEKERKQTSAAEISLAPAFG